MPIKYAVCFSLRDPLNPLIDVFEIWLATNCKTGGDVSE